MAKRNLEAEKNAISVFQRQRGALPSSSQDWAAIHRIAYPTINDLPDEFKATEAASYYDAGVNKPTTPQAGAIPNGLTSNTDAAYVQSLTDQTNQAKAQSDQAFQTYDDMPSGNEALRVLQEAIKAKANPRDFSQAPIGESEIFKQAGVGGYGALASSLAARGKEFDANRADFANTVSQMADVYKTQATTAQRRYEKSVEDYQFLSNQLNKTLEQMRQDEQQIKVVQLQNDLQRELKELGFTYDKQLQDERLAFEREKLGSGPASAPEVKVVDGQSVQWNPTEKTWDPIQVDPKVDPATLDKMAEIKTLATELLEDEGVLGDAVGPLSDLLPTLRGSTSDFKAKTNKLKALLTLDNLKLLKGAMSDKDLALLSSAATALSFNMSEEGFKEELKKIIANADAVTNAASNPNSAALKNAYEKSGFDQPYEEAVKKYGQDGLKKILESNGIKVSSGTAPRPTGTLSSQYESSGDPGAIGYDSTGGTSYGKYQLAHNNAKKFVEQSEYADEFDGIAFNSEQWKRKWKQIAATEPEQFERAQHEFIASTHYDPQVKKLASAGIDVASLSPAVREAIWSTAVQHGPGTDIVVRTMKSLPPTASDEEILRKLYANRWNGGKSFASSTEKVRNAVKNRFFGANGELNKALSLVGNQTYA